MTLNDPTAEVVNEQAAVEILEVNRQRKTLDQRQLDLPAVRMPRQRPIRAARRIYPSAGTWHRPQTRRI